MTFTDFLIYKTLSFQESADKLQEVLVQEQEEQQLNIKAPSEEAEQQSTPVTESG